MNERYAREVDTPYSVILLKNGHLYLSGMRLCVASHNGYQQEMCSKEIGNCAHKIITTLDSIINIIGRETT